MDSLKNSKTNPLLKTASLLAAEKQVLLEKATEKPFTGQYESTDEKGTYLCRQCGLALFRAQSKFHSGCGWPSFDSAIPSAVKEKPDADGLRTEILCARCDGHLGHVFQGENFTALNTRHCVNSLALDFVKDQTVEDSEEAIFAAGCFWGVQYLFNQLPGVLKTEVGYSGGDHDNPSYQDICENYTGHYEVIRVLYDPKKINYETLTRYFFEIHDPTQQNGQGPDHGSQYLSRIFYYNEEQKKIAEQLIQLLEKKDYAIATKLLPVKVFWPAEDYHQDYYEKSGKTPYCHHYIKRF